MAQYASLSRGSTASQSAGDAGSKSQYGDEYPAQGAINFFESLPSLQAQVEEHRVGSQRQEVCERVQDAWHEYHSPGPED